MSGIALCPRDKNECPNKDKCLRYIHEANEFSSWCDFPKICNADNGWTWFWEAETSIVKSE